MDYRIPLEDTLLISLVQLILVVVMLFDLVSFFPDDAPKFVQLNPLWLPSKLNFGRNTNW